MKTLQLQLRFLIPLLVALVIAALVVLPLMDQLTLRWFSRDLNTRGTAVANACPIRSKTRWPAARCSALQALIERAARDERLVAIGLCSNDNHLMRHSSAYPPSLSCAEARRVAREPDQRLELRTRRRARGRVCAQSGTIERRQPGAAARPELRRPAQPGHAPVPDRLHRRARLRDRAGHRGGGAHQLARLGVGHERHSARRGPDPAVLAAARAATGGERGARAAARPGGRVPAQPGAGDGVGPRSPARAAAHPAARRPGDRGVQPRALHPRAQPTAASSSSGPPAAW